MNKIWHKFSEEKPKKEGSYLTISESDFAFFAYGSIMELCYYPSAEAFNWDGIGEDTEIKVLYWANIEDVLPEELKGGDKR